MVVLENKREDNMKKIFITVMILALSIGVSFADELNRANELDKKGMEFYKKGNYIKSIEFFLNALKLKKQILDENDIEISTSYNNIGRVYEHRGNSDYPKALSYYKKSLAIREKILGKEHLATAQSYNLIGLFYHYMGDYSKAISYYKKTLAISKKNLGDEHPTIATIYNNIGGVYDSFNNYSESLNYYKKSLGIREKVLGKKHPITAKSYFNIGLLYFHMGDYIKSLTNYQKSLSIYKNKLGKEHPQTANNYSGIGAVYQTKGNYQKSLLFYQKSLLIHKKVFGEEHRKTAGIYNNIATLYNDMSKYSNALNYHKKALSIRKRVLGEEHIDTATSYNNIGLLYQDMGEYKKALNSYKKALSIRKRVLGEEHIDTATSYNNIGVFYQSMGEYSKALKYLNKALIRTEKVLGKEHAGTAKIYNNIGALYNVMEDYEKALDYTKLSVSITEKVFGKEHINTAISYNNLGSLYQENMKEYEKALIYYQKSLDISKKNLGEKNRYTAVFYRSIGSLYNALKNYPKSLKNLKKSLAIVEKISSKEHRYTAILYNSVGTLYQNMGNYSTAYKYAKKSFNIFIKDQEQDFQILNTKEKESYLKLNKDKTSLLFISAYFYSRNHKNNTKSIFQETFNSWINYKGSIFDSENSIATLYENATDKALKEKIEALTSSKRRLAQLYQSIPEPKEQKRWQENLKKTEQTITELTNQIAIKAESFKEQQGLKSISYQDIANNLQEDELYIDYVKAGEYYYVFTLDRKENISFTQIDTKSTKEINMLVKTFRENITKATDSSLESLSKLYELTIEKPLSTLIQSKKRLIISPDGALRLLPFEAMFDKTDNKYFIETKEIRYIPSGKELVRLYKYSHNQKSKNKVVIFANPNFKATNIRESKIEEEISITPNTNRGAMLEKFYDKFRKITPLPGTKKEADNIKNIFHKSLTVIDYQEEEANEANLMQVKEPKILHIATHGFFINDNSFPNPMLKSGIILSGATSSTIRGKSDGIVTALKLSGLKLKGTDLVVLSACKTGVVDINSTESVSGLGKAFIQAGAKDIVMSLWSVNDQATEKLMTSFYEEMQSHSNYSKALKEAKLKMIRNNVHPFYWAGFILSGL